MIKICWHCGQGTPAINPNCVQCGAPLSGPPSAPPTPSPPSGTIWEFKEFNIPLNIDGYSKNYQSIFNNKVLDFVNSVAKDGWIPDESIDFNTLYYLRRIREETRDHLRKFICGGYGYFISVTIRFRRLSGHSHETYQVINHQDNSSFDVVLASYNNKINAIKAIKEVTNKGLAESNNLVNKLPVILRHNVSTAEAEFIIKIFAKYKEYVEIKESQGTY